MASLIEGKRSDETIATLKEGEFLRQESHFRNTIQPEAASPGRYHLYVSYACPWAHRTLIVRSLKKLDNSLFGYQSIYGRGWLEFR
jgi:glutathionyl-hydroquinone reductase